MVDSLLKRKGVNPNLQLSWPEITPAGSEKLAQGLPKLLLQGRGSYKEGGTTPTTIDYLAIQPNVAPISRKNSHDSIVTLLLQLSYLNPGAAMGRFIKPHKPKGIVRLLLVRPNAKPHPHVNQGGTPLSWATERGQTSGIMVLRECRSC